MHTVSYVYPMDGAGKLARILLNSTIREVWNLMSEKDKCLAEIGFSNFDEYKQSYLWTSIKKHILWRDANICRSKYCRNRATEVVTLAYSVPILLGKSPHCLVSVCPDCFYEIEIGKDGEPRPTNESLSKTLFKLTESSLVKGVSNPYIGKWFRNQFDTNITVRKDLLKELKELNLNV